MADDPERDVLLGGGPLACQRYTWVRPHVVRGNRCPFQNNKLKWSSKVDCIIIIIIRRAAGAPTMFFAILVGRP